MSRLVRDDLLARVPGSLFVDGKWVASSSGATFAVTDPATGDELARVADATPADGLTALGAAAGAAEEWARTAPRDRAERLRAAFEAVTTRADDLALLISLEMGKPLGEASGEVAYGAEFLRWYAEEAVRISGHYGPAPGGSGRMIVTQRPVGPCYLITPWNFPLAMATRKIAPALAAGCTVVVKPAELTPLTTLYLAALLAEAGVPPGVVNVVTTSDPGALSGPLLADPRLRKLSFTGSTAVGRRLLAGAADGVLRTSMELGGNAPFLVFADADIPSAVEGAMIAKFRNIGQACTAANRLVVHESVAEEFVGRLCERVDGLRLGPGTEKGVTIGPLINAAAVAKTTALVEDAVRRGATVLRGGTALPGPGNFFPPTVLIGVSVDARLLREEIFGPVVAVMTFRDEDEAVLIANDTEYGLVGYAYTRDLARAQRLIDSLHTGMVGINVGMVSEAAAPFGGIKQSGLGREGGPEGIREYLATKYALTADPWVAS